MKLPHKSPNLNARCESLIGNLQRECLNHFASEFKNQFLTERPHQGLGNERIIKSPIPEKPILPSELACSESLGGLLKHYHHKAA